MKIRCEKCNLNLGEIRDATLRKNISYFCNSCTEKLKRLDIKEFRDNPLPRWPHPNFANLIDNLFNYR